MLIAEEKKKKNIIEYILYLFQIEDTIRAFNFDIDVIDEKIICGFGKKGYEHQEIRLWYKNFIDAMTAEKVEQKGHVSHVKNALFNLVDLSRYLLHNDEEYKRLFEEATPSVSELLLKSKGKVANEIEACISALYGAAILKAQGKPVSEETIQGLQPITKLLAYLGKKFHNIENDKEKLK